MGYVLNQYNKCNLWFYTNNEPLNNDVDPCPKMHLLHEDHLMQEDNIVANFPSYTLHYFHFNDLPSRYEALMSYVCPSTKVFLTHEDALDKKNDNIKTSLHENIFNSLSPKD